MSGSLTSLLDTAKRICDLNPFLQNDKISATAGRVFNEPLWLGPNVLLAQSRFANGAFYRAYQIELEKRQLLPCPGLNKIIRNFRGSWSLSGNRKWVLWREGWLEREYQFTASRIDGSQSVRWTVGGEKEHETPFFWLPNNQQWIRLLREGEANSVTGIQFYDLAKPLWQKRISLPTIKEPSPLGLLADGTLLLCNWCKYNDDNEERRTLKLTALPLGSRNPKIQTSRVPLPGKGIVADLCPSSDGKHLAWLLFQGRVKTESGEYLSKKATLFLSTLEGRNPRALGTIPFLTDRDAFNTVLHGWFPDTKRVLLESRNKLFSVSIGETPKG